MSPLNRKQLSSLSLTSATAQLEEIAEQLEDETPMQKDPVSFDQQADEHRNQTPTGDETKPEIESIAKEVNKLTRANQETRTVNKSVV